GAPGRGGRRPPPAQPGRNAPAVGARLPDPLAACHGVLLPAQARAGDERPERLLRRWLRTRRGARGRLAVRAVSPGAPRRGRRSRTVRRGLLHVQRGDGLVLPVPRRGLEGVLLPGRGSDPRRRGVARGAALSGEPPRAPALLREAPRPPNGRARAPAADVVASPSWAAVSRRPWTGVPRMR